MDDDDTPIPVPTVAIDPEALNRALDRAVCEQMEDGNWFVSLPDYPGAWSSGSTKEAAITEMASVLRDWVAVGVYLGNEIPEPDGIRLLA